MKQTVCLSGLSWPYGSGRSWGYLNIQKIKKNKVVIAFKAERMEIKLAFMFYIPAFDDIYY